MNTMTREDIQTANLELVAAAFIESGSNAKVFYGDRIRFISGNRVWNAVVRENGMLVVEHGFEDSPACVLSRAIIGTEDAKIVMVKLIEAA